MSNICVILGDQSSISGVSKVGPQGPPSCLFSSSPISITPYLGDQLIRQLWSSIRTIRMIWIRCVAPGRAGKRAGRRPARTHFGLLATKDKIGWWRECALKAPREKSKDGQYIRYTCVLCSLFLFPRQVRGANVPACFSDSTTQIAKCKSSHDIFLFGNGLIKILFIFIFIHFNRQRRNEVPFFGSLTAPLHRHGNISVSAPKEMTTGIGCHTEKKKKTFLFFFF